MSLHACVGVGGVTDTFSFRCLFSSVKQVKCSLQNWIFRCSEEVKTSLQVTPLHTIANGLIGFSPSLDIHFLNPVTWPTDLLIHKLCLLLDLEITETRDAYHGSSIVSRLLSVINTFRPDIVDW